MKGRMKFTRTEAEKIREILAELRHASRADRARSWGELREIGLYISDYRRGADAFTPGNFDRFVEIGEIEIG
jgi:hypothetical protein